MGEGAVNGVAEAVSVNSLTFEYPGQTWAISDLSLHLKPGSRCLLIGANGAGELYLRSTLLMASLCSCSSCCFRLGHSSIVSPVVHS